MYNKYLEAFITAADCGSLYLKVPETLRFSQNLKNVR